MRKWINVCLTESHELDIASGYDAFVEIWNDHASDDFDDECPSKEKFEAYAYDLLHHIEQNTLYRGIVGPLEVLNGEHLGVYWSLDHEMARSFSQGGGSNYDERFGTADHQTSHAIIVEIESPRAEQIDIVETTGFNVAGGEDEIRLKVNQPVRIRRVWVNGRETNHPVIGQIRLT